MLCSVNTLILTRAPSWQTGKHSEAGGAERIGRGDGDKVGISQPFIRLE